MAPQLPRDPHRLEIPHHDGAVTSPRGEIVSLAVEAHHGGVAGANGVGDAFWIVLKQVVVRQEKIHNALYGESPCLRGGIMVEG